MKKIIYSILIVFVTGLVSCKKFLQEENLSGITDENFYSNAAGYEALVNSCYASLRGIYDLNPSLFEYGTDLTTRGEIEPVSGTVGDLVIRATGLNEYKTLAPDNSAVSTFFSASYVGIQRCNTGINRAGKVADLSETIRAKRIAELRFIRAYYYYLLVENFGKVPIVKDEINSVITHIPPNTEQEVFEFMVAELNLAIPNLDLTTTSFGRVTQGAAKHLLSLIHLTRGYRTYGSSADFTKAAQLAEEVISSGAYNMLPNFADVFSSTNQKNKEIIFSVQYDPTSLRDKQWGNGQNILFGWRIFGRKDFLMEQNQFITGVFQILCRHSIYTLYSTL